MRRTLLDRRDLATPTSVSELLYEWFGAEVFASDSMRTVTQRILAAEPEASEEWARGALYILGKMRDTIGAWSEDERVPPSALRAGAKWLAHARSQRRRLSRYLTTGEGGCGLMVMQVEEAILVGAAMCARKPTAGIDWSLDAQAQCAQRRLLDLGLVTDAAIICAGPEWVALISSGRAYGLYHSVIGVSFVTLESVEIRRMSLAPTIAHELIHSTYERRHNRSQYISRIERLLDEALVETLTRYVVGLGTHGVVPGASDEFAVYGWFVRVLESVTVFRDAPTETERARLIASCVAQPDGARCAWLAERVGITESEAAEDLQALALGE